ncbi:domain of Kin17 curved DNA-binding protein-domain-containing protein [Lentinula aff. lateritia]|uniref:Domain of Kin17 curved DNA-binding protein-domain-containing protein n=1 Tax=Lentinula aff. lateritia TaxID=2804960 RepID=A0ACC1UCY5_9AGAR|nr:domain of Kin17 curved DNA-binding protein-domain-containing protein [Lentinula aff. lateritia]
MPRAEVGTPKYVANKMKSKGLQRLRWYCQVCEKQCRDENGFKCHAASESHLRQMLVVGEHAGKHISNFSQEFQSTFVALLSRRFGTKRVRANQVYQEYIADKHHLHMNSTRWVTLTEFIKHLGRTGVARVDETEKGWFIAWIDNSPKALAKAEASMKKERATTSDEQRERTLIAEQIERAAAEAGPSRSETPPEDLGLKRDEGAQKVVLSLSAKAADAPKVSPPAPLKMNALKSSALNPLKPVTNPFKRPNVFKSTTASSSSSTGSSIEKDAKKRALPMSAAERLIVEEQERKRRRMDKESLN